MTDFLADPNATMRPPHESLGPCPLCGSRTYWWRPGFVFWVCYGCAIPADVRHGFEMVTVAWTPAEWAEYAAENRAVVDESVRQARNNRVRFAMYDPLGIVAMANAPIEPDPPAAPDPETAPPAEGSCVDEPAAAGPAPSVGKHQGTH